MDQAELTRQLLGDLVVESLEGLDSFENEMLSLEGGGAPNEALRNAFRAIHTIKGSSGCLGLHKVEKVAHAAENLLSLMRDGKMAVTTELISSLLRCSDVLRGMMHEIERTGGAGASDHSELIALLHALQNGPVRDLEAPAAFGFFDGAPGVPDAVPAVAHPAPVEPSVVPAPPVSDPPAAATSEAPAERVTPPAEGQTLASESAIRVDIGQIDRLMNLVGELVLARNQIMQYAGQRTDSALSAAVQRVDLITTELQESVMKTRMQPVGNVWAKFPRIVRDLANDLSKRVSLVMEGADTELDRSIIEAIKDPLTHILRNSIDHGLELPDVRTRAGKAAEGLLHLRAFHEGGQVIIEINDDGAGIATDRVLRKAVQRGLVTEEQAARMSEREVLALVFAPGFSTAEQVTNVSGRGVGMDVVRTNIERIGGSVDLQSETGRGTTVRIKIPLTLAIIPALIVSCSGDRFAIPQASLVELVRLEAGTQAAAVEYVDKSPVFRLRGRLLPLVYLNRTLETGAGAVSTAAGQEDTYIVVLEAEGMQFGLVVDAIHDTEEIVVKPLGKQFKSLSVYAGATIMGDGRVALILDVFGIARRAGILQEAKSKTMRTKSVEQTLAGQGQRESLLLVRVGGHRIAVRLDKVTRLEDLAASSLERAGNREVVQYRGRIMPLVRVGEMLGFESAGTGDTLRVVVSSLAGREAGLVIDGIEDILEESLAIDQCAVQPGLAGTAVLGGRVANLLDLDGLALIAGFGARPAA